MSGAGSDLQTATYLAMSYIGQLGMGPTLLAMGASGQMTPPGPVLRLADRLLDDLFAETKRLIREKEYAVHAIAGGLMQKGELIGSELEEIFDMADLANPEAAKAFVRHPVVLPKMSEDWGEKPDSAPALAIAAATAAEGKTKTTA
jgi:hypothetical protein